MPDDSQAFSGLQTVIPTPYPDDPAGARQAPALPPQHVQDRMFTFPDVMRGQLNLETGSARLSVLELVLAAACVVLGVVAIIVNAIGLAGWLA